MRPPYRGGRPAWSTALRSGRSPYRFAGSNPAPRTTALRVLNPDVLNTMISFESEQGAVLTTDALSTEDVLAIVAATGFGVSA